MTLMMLATMSSRAGDHDYFVVESQDGTVNTFASNGLQMAFATAGETTAISLFVTAADGTVKTFKTADLKSMRFCQSATGIASAKVADSKSATAGDANNPTFNLAGQRTAFKTATGICITKGKKTLKTK